MKQWVGKKAEHMQALSTFSDLKSAQYRVVPTVACSVALPRTYRDSALHSSHSYSGSHSWDQFQCADY